MLTCQRARVSRFESHGALDVPSACDRWIRETASVRDTATRHSRHHLRFCDPIAHIPLHSSQLRNPEFGSRLAYKSALCPRTSTPAPAPHHGRAHRRLARVEPPVPPGNRAASQRLPGCAMSARWAAPAGQQGRPAGLPALSAAVLGRVPAGDAGRLAAGHQHVHAVRELRRQHVAAVHHRLLQLGALRHAHRPLRG
eukprot:scaffold5944_cov248-Pinguiococcus_pyrenoidosus.AAC.7